MKKCPFCAEEIQDEAIVCKHCGRDVHPPVESVSEAAPDVGTPPKPVGKSGKTRTVTRVTMAAGLVIVVGIVVVLVSGGGGNGSDNDEVELMLRTAFMASYIEVECPDDAGSPPFGDSFECDVTLADNRELENADSFSIDAVMKDADTVHYEYTSEGGSNMSGDVTFTDEGGTQTWQPNPIAESGSTTTERASTAPTATATATATTTLSATGEIDRCRSTGEAVLDISGGEVLAPWPKGGESVTCTVRIDDPAIDEDEVDATLPPELLVKVTQGGSFGFKVDKDFTVWTGPGMWAQVNLESTNGSWEVTRIVSSK